MLSCWRPCWPTSGPGRSGRGRASGASRSTIQRPRSGPRPWSAANTRLRRRPPWPGGGSARNYWPASLLADVGAWKGRAGARERRLEVHDPEAPERLSTVVRGEHAALSAAALARWGVDKEVVAAVRAHHDLPGPDASGPALAHAIA